MAMNETVFNNTLDNLRSDVESAEESDPSQDLLGTLRTNLEVCWRNRTIASMEQLKELVDLRFRSKRFLQEGEYHPTDVEEEA